jgi:hypothetical protein
MRPVQYWRGFGAPVWVIIASLTVKLVKGIWLSGVSRQKQNYWWKGWGMNAHRKDSASTILPCLESDELILATHSTTRRTVTFFSDPPYRSFSLPLSSGP